jgi:hypothetical protein
VRLGQLLVRNWQRVWQGYKRTYNSNCCQLQMSEPARGSRKTEPGPNPNVTALGLDIACCVVASVRAHGRQVRGDRCRVVCGVTTQRENSNAHVWCVPLWCWLSLEASCFGSNCARADKARNSPRHANGIAPHYLEHVRHGLNVMHGYHMIFLKGHHI